MKKYIIIVLAVTTFAACKKDKTPEYNIGIKGELSVEFDNIAGSSDLQLNTATYTNALGESFKVTKFKYYVSNFVLTNTSGVTYTVPQDSCYFLIDESDASTHEAVLRIPEGEYKTLTFTIGVDSLRNTKDVSERTGVLDPAGTASDMYWGWNSGYIFMKFEGTSPVITGMGNAFMYHIGGFGGYSSPSPNNIKVITLDLTTRGTAKVKQAKGTNIHLMADVLKIVNGATNISFASLSMVHAIAPGVPLANNYTAMFVHDHTEN